MQVALINPLPLTSRLKVVLLIVHNYIIVFLLELVKIFTRKTRVFYVEVIARIANIAGFSNF